MPLSVTWTAFSQELLLFVTERNDVARIPAFFLTPIQFTTIKSHIVVTDELVTRRSFVEFVGEQGLFARLRATLTVRQSKRSLRHPY